MFTFYDQNELGYSRLRLTSLVYIKANDYFPVIIYIYVYFMGF